MVAEVQGRDSGRGKKPLGEVWTRKDKFGGGCD
ncbi:hypothetical protein HmCmsJML075_01939 [Escherichia coli]|nr:hypothetical protein HmCmsJML075_01939 [Escherichia coli]